ncbi:hypothetical protein F0L74_03760 [Chitinophaga agrisoli]|uniref:Uncharacterized protein n=1 Tax=Chitinophaga agrisoli TaxID=2607653 RepID=A0A5B2W3T7_9BACT|nr:hypothetical protein [Chitinophaga agrisoli]KAA2245087.1 hypothetical protein F0L74_03760 [Chitinophaga agrisoli]
MRKITCLLIPAILLGFSCHPTGDAANTGNIAAADSAAVTDAYQPLLSRYRDVSFDTLPVFPADTPDDTTYQFHGHLLDSTAVQLLVKDVGGETHTRHDGFFACYKFSMDSGRIGLITRVPSEYLSSSIQLFILDPRQQKITDHVELAEDFGDAGDAMTKTAWLFRNRQLQLQTFQRIHFSHDNSVDNENDTTVEQSDSYHLIGFSKPQNDTLSSDSLLLVKRFMHLAQQ